MIPEQCVICGAIGNTHDLMCSNAPHNKIVRVKDEGFSIGPLSITPSGSIQTHPTTEIRSVSSTGGEKGVKPQAHSYLPRKALDVISEVYSFGAKKYAAHNWRRGYEWSKSYDALQRHLTAWWDREENDPESGLSHLGHAGFHVFALIVFSSDRKKYGEFDDRYQEAK